MIFFFSFADILAWIRSLLRIGLGVLHHALTLVLTKNLFPYLFRTKIWINSMFLNAGNLKEFIQDIVQCWRIVCLLTYQLRWSGAFFFFSFFFFLLLLFFPLPSLLKRWAVPVQPMYRRIPDVHRFACEPADAPPLDMGMTPGCGRVQMVFTWGSTCSRP